MSGTAYTAAAERPEGVATGVGTAAVRVAVVDDHRLFLGGLTHLLGADPRFEVVGMALSGEEFLELDCVRSRGVEVAFMDIDMPGMGGVEATRRAVERWPGLRVMALSMHGDREFYLPMLEAGAKGFLMKSSDYEQVAAAALRVAAGVTYFSPELTEALAEAMPDGGALTAGQPRGDGKTGGSLSRDGHRVAASQGVGTSAGGNAEEGRAGGRRRDVANMAGGGHHDAGSGAVDPLSEREMEVLPLVCLGLSSDLIAERLFISKRTVDKHRANIMAKTGCRNTASLVIYTIKHNLIDI
jgi:DNA-binding NarL/FixJ family response regulator